MKPVSVMVLEKTLESPLDCKEIQPIHPKGNQSWIVIGRTDAKAETPTLWPPDAKNWLIGKDPNDGKDWRREEKGTTEDEMVGWRHQLNACEFKVSSGSWWRTCCSPWGRKELDMTEWLNWFQSGMCSYTYILYTRHVKYISHCVLCHVQLFVIPRTVAHQAPLSMGFSRQEYWSGLHLLLQGIFLTQGSDPYLLHLLRCRQILYPWATWEGHSLLWVVVLKNVWKSLC